MLYALCRHWFCSKVSVIKPTLPHSHAHGMAALPHSPLEIAAFPTKPSNCNDPQSFAGQKSSARHYTRPPTAAHIADRRRHWWVFAPAFAFAPKSLVGARRSCRELPLEEKRGKGEGQGQNKSWGRSRADGAQQQRGADTPGGGNHIRALSTVRNVILRHLCSL